MNMESYLQRFDELLQFVKEKLSGTLSTNVLEAIPQMSGSMSVVPIATQESIARREIVAKLIASVLGLAASFGFTFFALRYMSNAMDPTKKEMQDSRKRAEAMLAQLGVRDVKLTDYELCIAANLVDPTSMTVSWDDIGGLDDVVEQIQDTVIFPFRRRDLFAKSALVQAPKGVLLYGPPGCGKTMLAKATARAAHARFINLQISTLVDKWYGESQKRAQAVFSLALKLQPAIIFIDEIDSFLRTRNVNDHEATLMIKTQFMSFWDGLVTDPSCQVMVMGATNRPQDVDAAILRRMPCKFEIGLPAMIQRAAIFTLQLEAENIENGDMVKLGKITSGFSGSDIQEICRVAALRRVHNYVAEARRIHGSDYCDAVQGQMRAITMEDLEYGVNNLRKSKNIVDGSILLD